MSRGRTMSCVGVAALSFNGLMALVMVVVRSVVVV
jgi:hypothetical protein